VLEQGYKVVIGADLDNLDSRTEGDVFLLSLVRIHLRLYLRLSLLAPRLFLASHNQLFTLSRTVKETVKEMIRVNKSEWDSSIRLTVMDAFCVPTPLLSIFIFLLLNRTYRGWFTRGNDIVDLGIILG